MEADRRSQKRRRFTYYMPVVDANTLKIIGHLADISPGGIKLDCEQPLPVNMSYRLRVDLTPELATKSYLIFHGRSRWCQVDRLAPNSFNVGFEINVPSSDDAVIFRRMYENYALEPRW